MNNNNKKSISEDKILYLLVGSVVNMGIMYIANALNDYAKQDAWMSAFVGGIYPAYIVLCACYLKNKHPNENILVLSNKFFGKYIGTIFNIMIMFVFIIFLSSGAVAASNFIKTYVSIDISQIEFILIFLLVGAFGAHKGINTIIKISEFIFYSIIPFWLIGINVFKYGSILNVMPIGGSGLQNILKASISSLYAYGGIEVILVLYSDFNDTKKVKKYALISVLLIVLAYVSIAFMVMVYWGNDIIKKTIWSSVYIVESIRFPIVNNFRFLLFFFWTLVTLKAVSIYYYFCNTVLTHIFKKYNMKDFYLFIYAISVLSSLYYKNEIVRRDILGKIMPYVSWFNIIFTALIVILTFIEKEDIHEG